MINRLLHSLPPQKPHHNPWSSNRYEFVYMQMSHHRHCAVASTCRLYTQWQSSVALTRTSHHASSSGTSWTGTGWRRPPFRSPGRPCRCQSPPGRPSWTHLEGKGNDGCDSQQRTKTESLMAESHPSDTALSNHSLATVTMCGKSVNLWISPKAFVCLQ